MTTTKNEVETEHSLIMLLHGESGVGKSPISHTCAAPRLILDSENGSRFIKGNKVRWNPLTEACPEPGEWETCTVQCRDFPTFMQAMTWLQSGSHPFRSVVVDSLSELQKRCKDAIPDSSKGNGYESWGILLDTMETAVRSLRDLTMHPTNPLQNVVILALSDEKKGKMRPLVQGGLTMSLPGLVDVIGYVLVEPDATGLYGPEQRIMQVQPDAMAVAKDRTTELPSGGIVGVFGPRVRGPINIEHIRRHIYGEAGTAA